MPDYKTIYARTSEKIQNYEGKEAGTMEKKGYAGSIKNGGTQVVKAPSQTTDQKKGNVKTGNDLRTRTGKK